MTDRIDFSFEDHAYNRLLRKLGIYGNDIKSQLQKILIPIAVCWIPLMLITLVNGNFWTGDQNTSFITNYDTQARFLISMPIFILAETYISKKIDLLLGYFIKSGIVKRKDEEHFYKIIQNKTRFLKSYWTDIVVFVICYIHVFVVFNYESEFTSLLTWHLSGSEGDTNINAAGYWSMLLSRPFFLFLVYRWLLRIIIWSLILRNISKLDLRLFAMHPDLRGGLGFLGLAIQYFVPVALALSATVAGNMADFVTIEGVHVVNLRLVFVGYLLFITILFTIPLFPFISNLIAAKEKGVIDMGAFANGLFSELSEVTSKGYLKVERKDLDSMEYSAVADLNAVVENTLNMKFLPFTMKDLLPLWALTAFPFIGVVLTEIPLSEVFNKLLSLIA